jgi:hypothetical protein
VQFGLGTTCSIGSALIHTPIGDIVFHVMPVDTPFLLCLGDMDNLGVSFDNIANKLVIQKGDTPNVLVFRRFGHVFMLWDVCLQTFLIESVSELADYFLTNTELRRLHRRFSHPSVHRL